MDTRFKSLIEYYIRAKDESKPHLMAEAFSEDATLVMDVRTESIAFPSRCEGREQVTETLVRSFNQSYENIYTFCLSDSIKQKGDNLTCRWLVGMSEKSTGAMRVGYGDYEWLRSSERDGLIEELVIVIRCMLVLPPQAGNTILPQLARLPYPWPMSGDIAATLQGVAALSGLCADLNDRNNR